MQVSDDRHNSFIMGIVTTEIPANTLVKATLAGVRNPRYLVPTASNFPAAAADQFSVFSYDRRGEDDSTNLIDSGYKGYIAITELQQFTTFSVEPKEVINGAVGSLMVTWYSRVET